MEGMVYVDEHSALLSIDQILDFYFAFGKYPMGTLPVPGAVETISTTNIIMPFNWPFRVMIRDWHPKDHLSFKDFPAHAVAKSKGAELHPAIKRGPDKKLLYGWFHLEVRKGTAKNADAFGGFKDRRGYPVADGKLDKFLKENEIKKLFLMGNEAMHCVHDNCLQALRAGYEVYVIREVAGAFTLRVGQLAFRAMEKAGAHIIGWRQLEMC